MTILRSLVMRFLGGLIACELLFAALFATAGRLQRHPTADWVLAIAHASVTILPLLYLIAFILGEAVRRNMRRTPSFPDAVLFGATLGIILALVTIFTDLL
jgi:hypothetical protein